MAYYGTGYYGSGSGGIFAQGIFKLQEMGIADVILPFILVFTIVFAVMQKTKILGTEKVGTEDKPRKNFNAVIALVMALAVIIPHVTGTYPSPESDVVNIMNQALPNVSVVLIAVIMMLLIIGVFGGDVSIAKTSLAGWAVVFSVLATIFIFGSAANWYNLPNWLYFLNDSDTQALIVIILVFAILIWFITKEDKPKDPKKYGGIEDLGRIMGYKKD
jgi:membrane protease YdiL (CAAX protease family)